MVVGDSNRALHTILLYIILALDSIAIISYLFLLFSFFVNNSYYEIFTFADTIYNKRSSRNQENPCFSFVLCRT